MTTTQKIAAGVVVVLGLLGSLAFFGVHLGGNSSSQTAGGFFSGDTVTNPQWFTNGFSAGSVQQFFVDAAGRLFRGGNTRATALESTEAIGNCGEQITNGTAGYSGISYAASSTLFAFQNPYAATSTFTMNIMTVTGQATTSSLVVGTSTQPYASSASGVSATL